MSASPKTTAACADSGDDDSGSIGGTPDACVFGDPPYNSPDLNGIYYTSPGTHPSNYADGVDWSPLAGYYESMQRAEIMIR